MMSNDNLPDGCTPKDIPGWFDDPNVCDECEGKGWTPYSFLKNPEDAEYYPKFRRKCERCDGTGESY